MSFFLMAAEMRPWMKLLSAVSLIEHCVHLTASLAHPHHMQQLGSNGFHVQVGLKGILIFN